MPLAAVSDILFLSDEFWGNSTLNSLRMLTSTCKGFRAELQGSAKKATATTTDKETAHTTTTERAMLAMIRHRPTDNSEWTMGFIDAKYHFSIHAAEMIRFCSALPVDDPCHMSEYYATLYRSGLHSIARIRFIDAYRLVSRKNNGIAAAMERRARHDRRVLQSAKEVVALFSGPSNTMRLNVRAAYQELEDVQLVEIQRNKHQKNKRVPRENELIKSIRLLKVLHQDIRSAMEIENRINDDLFRHELLLIGGIFVDAVDIPQLEKSVAEYRSARKTLVARYRAHSVYCPGIMGLDCLLG